MRIFGHGVEELIGRPLRTIYANDADYEQISRRALLPISNRQIEAPIITFARHGGAHFPGVAAFTQIVDKSSGSFGFLTVVRDVSGEPANIVDLPMTRADIADFLGLTIETVSRTLTKLAKEKTVVVVPDGVRLLSTDRLDQLAAA